MSESERQVDSDVTMGLVVNGLEVYGEVLELVRSGWKVKERGGEYCEKVSRDVYATWTVR